MSLAYFRRRLNETQRWVDAPPVVRYHAAASNVDDDALEASGEPFGAPYGESGFGTSEVFQELLSKDPKYVPIADLKGYQQGLMDTGYLPPTYVPTGQWDEVAANADRRAARDAFNTSRSGGAWTAASVQTLFRYLGYTMPTSVFDGMYGIAQGIVQDAATAISNPVAVAEEGGFLGGAAVGAGIGATAGLIGGPLAPVTSGVGALVGGAIGGVAGFFGDFFDDDEDEEGDWNRIVGALSPIDEIRSGDAKHLFAALSTIMTASAVLKAGKVAVSGIQAVGGTGGIAGVRAGARQVAVKEGWRMAARDTVSPGILNQMSQAALKHRVWGTAAVSGTANAAQEVLTTGDWRQAARDFGTGALVGAAAGATVGKLGAVDKGAKAAIKALDAAPLARLQASNAGKVLQSVYTGTAAPTIVARGISEISGGETAIGEDIREADTASKLGVAGTVVDWTVGSMIFPSRLTPWKADDLVAGMKAMGSNNALLPMAKMYAAENGVSLRKAFDAVKEQMGKDKDGSLSETLLAARVNDSYLQYGIEERAQVLADARAATELGAKPKNSYERMVNEAKRVKILEEERSAIKAKIIGEVGETGDLAGSSTTGREIIEEAMVNQVGMQNFLATKGFNFNYWAQHQEASEHLNRASARVLAGAEEGTAKAAKFTPAVKEEYLVAQDFERFGGKTVALDPASGEELMHGTTKAFDDFSTSASNRYGRRGVDKFYFTDNPDVAKTFSESGGYDIVDPRAISRTEIDPDDVEAARSTIPELQQELRKAAKNRKLEVIDYDSQNPTWREVDPTDITPNIWEQALEGNGNIRIWKKGRSPRVIKEKVYGKTLDLRNPSATPDDLPDALKAKVKAGDWNWFENHSKELIDWARTKGYGKIRIRDSHESGGESIIAIPEFIGKKALRQVTPGEYEVAATRWVNASKALENADDASRAQLQRAHDDAAQETETVLKEMKDRGIIEQDIFDSLRPGVAKPQVEARLVDYLQQTAKLRPRRNDELTAELEAMGLDRYMAVTTGEDIIDYTHFAHQAEIEGLSEYTRRKSFFDTLSGMGTRVDASEIGKLRYHSIVRHLDKTAGDLLQGMDGRAVADKIYNDLKLRYDPEWMKKNRGIKVKLPDRGNIVRMTDETGKASRELFKIDPRDLDAEDIIRALDLDAPGVLREGEDVYDAANKLKRTLHVGAAFGADVAHPIATARALGASLRVNGLTGFNDFMRTTNFVPTKLMSKLPNEARFKRKSYGYLPQKLRRVSMALQFSLSPTFDASRYAEAIMFGKIRGGDIPVKAVTNPKKFIHEYEEGWLSPNTGQRISGQQAVNEMIEFGDRALYGRAVNKNFDEIQLQLLNRGVLGFKPREVEYAQAWWLAQKKARNGPLEPKDLEEIRETVMQIGQYGTKRTAMGNTAHFVFFPYLFAQKTVSAVVDFTLAAPARNMLIHEGIRRWYSVNGEDGTTMSKDFSKFMEKHIPIAAELGRINNLAYGISPGRFFLEGLMDKRTEGKLAQGLTSFFLPGGVHQGVADTAGAAAEALKNLFVPVVLVDSPETPLDEASTFSLMERLVPAYRDLDRWFFDSEKHGAAGGLLGASLKAGVPGVGGGTPRAQMSEYLDAKRVMGSALDALATQSGYASWDSLANSRPELRAVVDDLEGDLGQKYPDGARVAQEFTNMDAIKEQALVDIASKEDRTDAEEAINVIGVIETQVKALAAQTGRSQEEVMRMVAPSLRAYALTHVDDKQFRNLWDGLFRSFYGPLQRIEVA